MLSKSSLIVPIHNGIHYLAIFWKSLKPWLHELTELILIDDGSEQNVFSIFQDYEIVPIKHLRNERPKGFASAVNRGIESAEGDYLFILNSDLIFKNNFVQIMINRLLREPSIGILGSKLIFPQTGRVQVFGVGFTPTNHFHLFKHQNPSSQLISNDLRFQAAVFAAVCIPRKIQQEVGLLDEQYFNGYEDLDYSFRVRELGYQIAYEKDSLIYHWRLQSGFGRDVLRKENITRLWSKWAHCIESDLGRFFNNSIVYAKKNKILSSDSYDMIILSKGSEWEIISSIIHEKLTIHYTYPFNYRNKPNEILWLPQILPPDFIQIDRPIIYLIDEIPMLSQNHFWFDQRSIFAQDIIIDHLGNIIKANARL